MVSAAFDSDMHVIESVAMLFGSGTASVYPSHRGGTEIRFRELTQRLSELADHHIYSMYWWNGPRVHKENAVS